MNQPGPQRRPAGVANELKVDHALFLLGYSNLPSTGVGQIGGASLVALVAYQHAAALTLAVWWGYSVMVGLFYFLLLRSFKTSAARPEPDRQAIQRWLYYRRTLQFASSIGWGGLSYLMVPGATEHNAFVMIFFTGVVGHAAFSSLANDFPGSVASAVATSLIFISNLPRIFGEHFQVIVWAYVLYMSAMLVAMRNTQALLRNAVQLRLENEALALDNAEQAAMARQANRDKSEFLAAASHDLRQPVHALLLLVEAYRQQVPSAMNHPLMQHITQAGQSINGLFNALMELSRLESGSEKPVLAEFDLRDALQDVLQRSQPEAQAKGLQLRSFLAPGLVSTRVCSDQVLFKRVVGNLLSNAVRYTPYGGVLLSLRRAHGAAGVWVEVWDTGIGISEADQVRIFDPYVQLTNRERDRSKGMGLGLAIVKHAAGLLGLGISLRSVPGRGTRFRLELPTSLLVKREALGHTHKALQASGQALAQMAGKLAGRRVLLIDDDPLVRVAMQELLGSWGVALRCAENGDDDVAQVCGTDWTPECVLCDFRLPGALDGIDVLDMLQERYPQAIGILQTGELAQAVQARAEESGYMVLFKPVDVAVLASTLSTVLNADHVRGQP